MVHMFWVAFYSLIDRLFLVGFVKDRFHEVTTLGLSS